MRGAAADFQVAFAAVQDVGEVAALALAAPDKFNHQRIDLAGDSLSLRQVEDVHKRVKGQALPRTFTAFGWAATKASKDLGLMASHAGSCAPQRRTEADRRLRRSRAV